ncbi:MAG: hypothetical protein M1830_007235 [Pleopsidium flavum]|nr:MAG: hypothetical protein M1830_007235 [Pleopsidium flavum]
MAPLPSTFLSTRHVDPSTISDLSISSLELDRRSSPHDLPAYLSNLNLKERERLNTPTTTNLFKRESTLSQSLPLSPHDAGKLLRARNPAPDTNTYTHGAGTIPPDAINNKGVLALFGLLSASLVFASIWFFFWAKNGGFVWRKGDWSDYKSTVLRRKGPDGKTLSNATKSTELGGGSVVGSMDAYDAESVQVGRAAKKGRKVRGRRDEDVRAYRHEKPARVGGLNRQPDGSYHDYTNTEPSEISQPYAHPHTPHKASAKDTNNKHLRQPSYSVGTEDTISSISADDRRPLRSSPHHHRHSHSNHSSPAHTPNNRSRQSSPRKHRATASHSQRNTYTEPIDFESRYTASEAETGTEGTGTKSYFHPIPGLGGKGKGGAVEKKGGNGGFRRGGGRRRDSLSDSEGETVTETVRS